MTIDVEAIYENGVLKLKRPVNLPERTEVHVTIEAPEPARTALGRKLLELRSRIKRSGAPALGWDEIDEEVAARRGGFRDGR
jgi:predicted DNA-binding antitoxin AbrB/MazE fold protein